jgi:putative oxidoreductase
MAYLATGTEVLGAVALLVGLGTRWFAVPLMVTMLVAAFSVHAKNGWQAIKDSWH